MTSTTEAQQVEARAFPCPAWCGQVSERHEFDSVTHEGAPARVHALTIGEVECLPEPHKTVPSIVYVDLAADEIIPRGPDQPHIALYADFCSLDAARARQVAALLMTAAERLDAVLDRDGSPQAAAAGPRRRGRPALVRVDPGDPLR